MGVIYLVPLFLYIPALLPGVETQPLLAVGVAIWALTIGTNRRAAVGFVGVALCLLLWVVIKLVFADSSIGVARMLQILVGPLVLFGAISQRAPPPSRRLLAAVAVYFLCAAAFELLLPNLYGVVASGLLSRATVADGHRGVSLFMPEPTYAAITVIYFLLLSWWAGMHWGFRHRWIEPLLTLCLLATGSTYVGLLLLALAYVRWPRILLLATIAAIGFVPVLDAIPLENEESIRAVVAISRIMASDFKEFLPSISVIDSSIGSRLLTNAASFLTPVYSPLGLGLDCDAMTSAFNAAGFDFAFDNPVLQVVMDDGCLRPQSYMATIALGFGVMAAVFLLLLMLFGWYAVGARRLALWSPPVAVASVILMVQGQLTNPTPWLLIFISIRARSKPALHKQPIPIDYDLPRSPKCCRAY